MTNDAQSANKVPFVRNYREEVYHNATPLLARCFLMSDGTIFDKSVILPEPTSKEKVEGFYNGFKDFLKPIYLDENVVANGPQWEISQKFNKLLMGEIIR